MSDGYPLRPLGEVMRLDIQRIPMTPATTYRLAGVLNAGQGLVAKGELGGGDTEYAAMNVLRIDQVVMRKLTAWEGPITVVPAEFDGFVVSNEFPTFTIGPELMPDWMRHVCRSPQLWAEMKNRVSGTVQRRKRLNPEQLLQIQLPIPPRNVQAQIVEVLDAVDAQIAALDAEADALAAVMAAIRSQLLQPGEGWVEVPVGHLAETRTGRAFPAEYQGNADGKVPYFKVADMNAQANLRHLTTPGNWLDSDGIAAVKPRICPPGTVVFPIIGAALATEKRRLLIQPSAFDQNLMGLVPNDRTIPEYLLAVMSSIRLSDLTQPGAVPSVNQKIVSAIRVPLAPREVQEQIVETMHAIQGGVDATYAENARLRAVRASLLSGLLDRTIDMKSAELEV